MDFTQSKKDIDDLIADFAKVESTSFQVMKNIWLSKKFSYIFEPSLSTNLAFFVQSLYSHAIGYMNATKASLSLRVGGLYCLYCLHETQPFKPPFKIYLSIEEVKKLRELVVAAKENGSKTVPSLVKKMLEKKIFLFGSLDFTEGAAKDTVNQLTDLQNARVQVAYEQLFSNTRIQDFVHLDMGTEIEVDAIKKISLDYEEAKKLAIREASEVVNVENIEHITEDDNHMRDAVEKIAEEWEDHRERFCQQTGIKRPERHEEDEPQLLLEDIENFDQELEQLLSDT